MKRINKILGIPEEEAVRFPDDCDNIRFYMQSKHSIFRTLSNQKIAEMWSSFSDDHYAGWLFVTDDRLISFAAWLEEDI